jgi:hypothetical protein
MLSYQHHRTQMRMQQITVWCYHARFMLIEGDAQFLFFVVFFLSLLPSFIHFNRIDDHREI